jgi:ABC-type phosphate transport system substrate-binding protein
LECGDTSPLSNDATCRVVPKRGLVRALQIKTALKIVLVCAVLFVSALRASAFDGVVVIVNEGVPTNSISAAALKDVYIGRTTYWPDGQSVKIAVLDDQITDGPDAALEEVSGMDTSHFKTFWQRMVFSGRGQMPQKIGDNASLVAYVASTKGAIAIVSADADLKGVKKLEIN